MSVPFASVGLPRVCNPYHILSQKTNLLCVELRDILVVISKTFTGLRLSRFFLSLRTSALYPPVICSIHPRFLHILFLLPSADAGPVPDILWLTGQPIPLWEILPCTQSNGLAW